MTNLHHTILHPTRAVSFLHAGRRAFSTVTFDIVFSYISVCIIEDQILRNNIRQNLIIHGYLPANKLRYRSKRVVIKHSSPAEVRVCQRSQGILIWVDVKRRWALKSPGMEAYRSSFPSACLSGNIAEDPNADLVFGFA